MTIRTALLEARFILGDEKLFDDMCRRFDKEIVHRSPRDFVVAKLEERDTRISKAGQSRYLVEPNVKEGKGGLQISIRCSRSPNMSIACGRRPISSMPACSRGANAGYSAAAKNSCGGCAAISTSSPAAPRKS